jgi:FKBP-type peptidyl-prolyl cis-trans isomerase (trigger factor)
MSMIQITATKTLFQDVINDMHEIAKFEASGHLTTQDLIGLTSSVSTMGTNTNINVQASKQVTPVVSLGVPQAPPVDKYVVLDETVEEEITRLQTTIANLTETNDRIMAQNIALLADLEAAHKAVRELRSEKDTLAVQLKRLLP